MANTCTQIYIHVVFAVEGRQSLIEPGHAVKDLALITTV
jgi:hypothetical protein